MFLCKLFLAIIQELVADQYHYLYEQRTIQVKKLFELVKCVSDSPPDVGDPNETLSGWNRSFVVFCQSAIIT